MKGTYDGDMLQSAVAELLLAHTTDPCANAESAAAPRLSSPGALRQLQERQKATGDASLGAAALKSARTGQGGQPP